LSLLGVVLLANGHWAAEAARCQPVAGFALAGLSCYWVPPGCCPVCCRGYCDWAPARALAPSAKWFWADSQATSCPSELWPLMALCSLAPGGQYWRRQHDRRFSPDLTGCLDQRLAADLLYSAQTTPAQGRAKISRLLQSQPGKCRVCYQLRNWSASGRWPTELRRGSLSIRCMPEPGRSRRRPGMPGQPGGRRRRNARVKHS